MDSKQGAASAQLLTQQDIRAGGKIFVITVVAVYIAALVLPQAHLPPQQLAALLVAGGAYLLWGFYGIRIYLRYLTPLTLALFYAVAIPLGGLVVYLTGGFFLAGLIMLPLASLSVQTLSPGKAALVCALVIVTLIVSYGLQAGWIVALSDGVGYLAGVLFVVFASRMAVRERETRVMAEALAAELEAGNRQLRRYAAQAEELAVTRERARLAAELHDSVGHSLTALDVQLALLVWLPPEQRAPRQAAVEQAQILVKQGLADLRRAVQALAPAALETFSLPEAITELTRDAGLPLDWQTEGKIIPLPPQTALPLYRAAQEALTNVQRHAPAALRVTMRLRYTPEAVSLSVENKGGSASPKVPAFRQGYGLRGLRRRAGALGGDFYAEPTPSGGFRLEMTLPVPGHG